ncbi:MAG: 16S rRNA (guanine(966)-N(2))-methyltransferase RsmD [Spirochaetales bacterium]|nr:16S rRNA (guanine(966)-N(2))-methyltransferase RsmD [Spirochaetales bacterium]
MRITGGKYRSRQIKCPKGIIRPAMDRMRESMFSILGDLTGQSFLDLFTGSGCIGIEAASRGAELVHLVEKDYIKKKVIQENISLVEEEIRLFLMPAEKYIKRCEREYDIIHLDPPFPLEGKEKFLRACDEKGILKPGGVLMMHYPDEESFPEQIGQLRQFDLRKYGRSQLIFYTRDE